MVKLRKEVEELRGERTTLKQAFKKAAQQRDELQRLVDRTSRPAFRKIQSALAPERYRKIAKSLHPDRLEKCSKAELDDAARLFLELRPLFE